MNENLDLTKILEGCPKGTKFYSTTYGTVEFIGFDFSSVYPILMKLESSGVGYFTKDGRIFHSYYGECTLFPSKTQRDWSKFERFWDNPETEKFENYNPKENNKKIEYRIWHIDAYAGWDDYDNSSDCNMHIDYMVNASFTKQDVIDMFCNKYNNSRVVVVCKCFLITDGSITYEQKLL